MISSTSVPLSHAQTVVIESQAVVRSIAAYYARRWRRPDLAADLEQAALAELTRQAVAGKYDPSRGSPTTWASRVVPTFVVRELYRIALPVRLPVPDSRRPAAAARFESLDESLFVAARDQSEERVNLVRVESAVARLPSPHERLVRELYGIGVRQLSPEQISRYRSVSVWPLERIERVHGEALSLLRGLLAIQEPIEGPAGIGDDPGDG